MTRTELKHFRAMLTAKHAELAQELGKRDGIAIERTADVVDEIQLAAERELKTRGLDRGSKLLTGVREALARIDNGAYGTCLHCEDEINEKRLRAVPWASLCIACQERMDRNQQPLTAFHEDVLRKAA